MISDKCKNDKGAGLLKRGDGGGGRGGGANYEVQIN